MKTAAIAPPSQERLVLYTYAHGKGCICCDDKSGEAGKRYRQAEANIPADFVIRKKITDPEELASINKEQRSLSQSTYNLGDELIWVKMSKYNDLMAWIGSQLQCANCKDDVGKKFHCKCRNAIYCNADCQRAHWPVHKQICSHRGTK
jgi:hypothetical protein